MSANLQLYLTSIYMKGARAYPYLDCWGLVEMYYRRELHIDISRLRAYETLENGLNAQSNFKRIEKPIDNCVVIYLLRGKAIHCGIFLDNNLLHTNERFNCTIEPIDLVLQNHKYERRYYEYIDIQQC